jgi:hypothetical protein
VKSADPRFADRFGQSLALTDFGIAVGAPSDETAAGTRRDSGIVHVFE